MVKDCKKDNRVQAMAWLWMPGYMHSWLERELGGVKLFHNHRLLSLAHVKGVRDIMREEVLDDTVQAAVERTSISSFRMDCLQAGVVLDAATMQKTFGVTAAELANYVAVECPRLALTENGVLRPWTRRYAFGRRQSRELQAVVGGLFWRAVADYDTSYAKEHEAGYPAVDMVTEFCEDTDTEEVYIPEIRREWQRKLKIWRRRQ